jgi:hypothetical protein
MDGFPADQRAVAVVAVAADPRGLAGVREIDAWGIHHPQGAADHPAVALAQLREVGIAGPVLPDRGGEVALERRLVPLDGQEVRRFPPPSSSGPAM